MGAVKSDITIDMAWFKGEDRIINIDVNQSDGSTAQDMTGWNLTWELKLKASDLAAAAKITKTVGSGITIDDGDGTNDRAAIVLDDDDTETLDPGIYYHQLRRTDAGNEIVLAYGEAHLRPSGIV